MTFSAWLSQFVGEDSPRGDLAFDVKHDKSAPKESSSRKRWLVHLRSNRACQEAIEALEEAFDEYKSR